MRLMITGSPGTGKTTLAKKIAKELKLEYYNEKDFALKHGLGAFNEENELEIPLKEFEKEANKELKKKGNIVFEGHVLCETKLNVDLVLLITLDPEILELRLEQRKYSMEKLMDNVFCEGINYCKKHLQRLYPPKKIIEIKSQASEKHTFVIATQKIQEFKN
jgi:adenylate kinase